MRGPRAMAGLACVVATLAGCGSSGSGATTSEPSLPSVTTPAAAATTGTASATATATPAASAHRHRSRRATSASPSAAPTPAPAATTARPAASTAAPTHRTSPKPSPTRTRTTTKPATGPCAVTGKRAGLSIIDQPTNASQPHQFSPRTLTVACGTQVTVTDNSQGVSHTWSSPGHWDSGSMSNGDTYSYTFRSVGTFNFMCAFHPSYMTGSVTVTK